MIRKLGAFIAAVRIVMRSDCAMRAKPDEPIFVLLGRDPMAGTLVRTWAAMRRSQAEDKERCDQAEEVADAMDAYALALGKEPFSVIYKGYRRREPIIQRPVPPAGTLRSY